MNNDRKLFLAKHPLSNTKKYLQKELLKCVLLEEELREYYTIQYEQDRVNMIAEDPVLENDEDFEIWYETDIMPYVLSQPDPIKRWDQYIKHIRCFKKKYYRKYDMVYLINKLHHTELFHSILDQIEIEYGMKHFKAQIICAAVSNTHAHHVRKIKREEDRLKDRTYLKQFIERHILHIQWRFQEEINFKHDLANKTFLKRFIKYHIRKTKDAVSQTKADLMLRDILNEGAIQKDGHFVREVPFGNYIAKVKRWFKNDSHQSTTGVQIKYKPLSPDVPDIYGSEIIKNFK